MSEEDQLAEVEDDEDDMGGAGDRDVEARRAAKEEMRGLSEDDKAWFIVQKGLQQVYQFVESAGLPHYYELFIANGFIYGNMIRGLSQHMVQTQFKITDPDEAEALLSLSGTLGDREDILFFRSRYGDPHSCLFDCTKGKKWIEERPELFEWAKAQDAQAEAAADSAEPGQLTYAQKWGIDPQDLAKFSYEGQWAAATSCDGFVFLWPLDLGTPDERGVIKSPCVRASNAHNGVATDFVVDWDRMESISTGDDCRAVIFDNKNMKIGSTVKNNSGVDVGQDFLSIDFDAALGKAAIGTADGPLKIASREKGKVLQVCKGHTDHIFGVRADWDANRVVTGSWDHTLGIWDLRSNKRTHTMTGHTQVINRIDVDFDKMLAVSWGAEPDFMMWDLKEGRCIKTIRGHEMGNNCGVVNWNTMECVTGGEDGLVKRWNLENGECTQTIECDHLQTLALDVNWDTGKLLTGSWDYKVRLWDLQTGKQTHELCKARRTITQVQLKGGRMHASVCSGRDNPSQE